MKKLVFLLMLSFPAAAFSAGAVFPLMSGPVTDVTGKLTAAQNNLISQKILSFQKEKGSQIAVCVTGTTAPLTIEQYGIELAKKWKIGRAKIDDGVIIIVALNDRKMRIEVGRGLEGAVTDLLAGRIIDRVMAPEFKQGDFYGGINSAVDSLISIIRGEELPALSAAPSGDASRQHDTFTTKMTIGLLILVVGFIIFILLVGLGKYYISVPFFYAVLFVGMYLTGAGSFIDCALYSVYGTIPGLIIVLIVKFSGGSSGGGGYSSSSGSSSDYSSSSSSSDYSSSSSSDYSSSSSSDSSSSSSDSSSYSGGGGDFGGGGASGGW
jgi:uncharacterized protein